MGEDATMSKVYETFYSDAKRMAEKETDRLRAIHSKFDEIYDKEKMDDKLDTEWYDLEQIDNNEDMMLSTDFTSESDDLMYKRYKMTQYQVRQTIQEYSEMIEDL